MKHLNILSLLGSALVFTLFTSNTSAQTVTDKEIKTATVPLSNVTPDMIRLEPVSYEYKKENKYKKLNLPDGKQYGLVAEDVEKVFPQLVTTTQKMVPAGKNNFKTVKVKTIDYNGLIPLLVASLKEQQEEIETLKNALQKMKVASK